MSEPGWEWPAEEIKRFGYRVVDLIAAHLTSLRGQPVLQPFPSDLAARCLDGSPLPEAGPMNSPPAVAGIFAEALAAAMNPSCAGGLAGRWRGARCAEPGHRRASPGRRRT